MRESVRITAPGTSRPEGILIPRKVLDAVFECPVSSVCGNHVYPTAADPTEAPGLIIVTNSAGADEIIDFLKQVGTKRSLEIADLLEQARPRSR